MELDIHGGTIQGSRNYQEDCFEICAATVESPSECLVVLCDGMGGHSGGALASHTVTKAFINQFLVLENLPPNEALTQSLRSAHEAIRYEISENSAPEDMGTTLVAVYVSNEDLYWVSVGDSHLYLYRKGQLEKLNEDHSMATVLDELAEIGRISKDEALSDPQRNALRSCLSSDDISLVDIRAIVNFLKAGDKLILATDGLDTLQLSALERLITKYKRKTSEIVVSNALAEVEQAGKPNQDNTTVVILSVKRKSWFVNFL